MAAFRSAFGLRKKVLKQLKDKARNMDAFKGHGGLLVDELKLSEHVSGKTSGHIESFIQLEEFSSPADKGVKSDHGMVILFVPFVVKWTQVIGTFAMRGNIKGDCWLRL
ncbi:hypothetical protein MRX96_000057 [Rhipicephalus microplus]